MLDLALSSENLHLSTALFLVAPDAREADVRAQLLRPAFSRIGDLDISYLPYSALERHQTAIARFGSGLQAIKAIAHQFPLGSEHRVDRKFVVSGMIVSFRFDLVVPLFLNIIIS